MNATAERTGPKFEAPPVPHVGPIFTWEPDEQTDDEPVELLIFEELAVLYPGALIGPAPTTDPALTEENDQ